MNATLTYSQGSGSKFDPDRPLDYFLRKLGRPMNYFLRRLGFDSGAHFLKCLLWAFPEWI
jgi:hypothetical protein